MTSKGTSGVKFLVHLGRFSHADKYIKYMVVEPLESSPTHVIQAALDHWYKVDDIGDREYDPGT